MGCYGCPPVSEFTAIQVDKLVQFISRGAVLSENVCRVLFSRYFAEIDCAGSYKIEGLGIALFEHIEGLDFTAITGLPLMAVCRMLAQTGIHPLEGSA